MPSNPEPPGIGELTVAQARLHPDVSGPAVQSIVEASWRAVLARLRWLEANGMKVELLQDVEPTGHMRGGIGG